RKTRAALRLPGHPQPDQVLDRWAGGDLPDDLAEGPGRLGSAAAHGLLFPRIRRGAGVADRILSSDTDPGAPDFHHLRLDVLLHDGHRARAALGRVSLQSVSSHGRRVRADRQRVLPAVSDTELLPAAVDQLRLRDPVSGIRDTAVLHSAAEDEVGGIDRSRAGAGRALRRTVAGGPSGDSRVALDPADLLPAGAAAIDKGEAAGEGAQGRAGEVRERAVPRLLAL